MHAADSLFVAVDGIAPVVLVEEGGKSILVTGHQVGLVQAQVHNVRGLCSFVQSFIYWIEQPRYTAHRAYLTTTVVSSLAINSLATGRFDIAVFDFLPYKNYNESDERKKPILSIDWQEIRG